MTRWKLTLAALLLASTPLAAQEHPYVNRGFDPEKLYQFGEIDSVDLQGGSVSITLPIGQRYPVSEKFSYGLSLVYSSNVWDYAGGGPNEVRAVPDRLANAGLSWRVSLGELFHPDDLVNPTRGRTSHWAYVGPDGGTHEFWPKLHESDSELADPDPLVRYSRDGSYLRLRLTSTHVPDRIEFPDGSIHSFEAAPLTTTYFRLKEIRDRYGPLGSPESWVRVAYENFADPKATTRRWRITDRRGREHVVHFVRQFYDTIGAVPNAYMIDKIELAAFDDASVGGDGVATYYFQYEPNTSENRLWRDCKDTDDDSSTQLHAARLSSLLLPDQTPADPNDNLLRWDFTYFNDSDLESCRRGQIATVQYPTGGKIRYEYQNIFLPGEDPCPEVDPIGDRTIAINERQIDLNGIDEAGDGRWFYGFAFSPYPASGPDPCKDNEPSGPYFPTEQQTTTVTTPLGDRTEHYFSVWSAFETSPNGFLQREFGLPFTRLAPAQPDGTLLSSRIVDCAGANCAVDYDREQYVLYESDNNNSTSPLPMPMVSQQNRRVLKSRTVYRDDEPGTPVVPHYTSVENSDFDGVGNYRRSKTNGDFLGTNVRESYARFNDARGTYPGSFLPVPVSGSGSEWILTTQLYTEIKEDQNGSGTATGGEISRQEFRFEPTTGFLQCARTLRNGTGQNNKDLIARYDRDVAGNVIKERYYGGDLPQGEEGDVWLPTGSLDCTAVGLRVPDYTIDHTYDFLSSSTQVTKVSQYAGLATPFRIADLALDRNTFLPKTTKDAATIPTFFKYDPLGRLKEVRPGVGAGVTRDAWTKYTYIDSNPRSVYIERCTPGQDCTDDHTLSEEYVEFDGFGRIWHEGRKIEDGYWNYRATLYDDMHHKRRQSNWVTEPENPNDETIPGTQYLNYDAYGRPGSIALADGKATTFVHHGDRQTKTTQSLATILGGLDQPVDRWEIRDRHGRLIRVEEASGSSGLPGTNYYYDETNRLSRVCQIGLFDSTNCKQTRVFTYDNAGLLTSEQHPEKGGTSGNGLVTYALFDARGHATRRDDGDTTRRLFFDFDEAERLRTVKDASGITWKEFTYDSAAGAGLGKVATTYRRNVLVPPAQVIYAVFETYEYLGRNGRPSKRSTALYDTGVAQERWEISAAYEALGGTSSIGYPRCFDGLCGTGSGTPVRTQAFNYAEGLLRSVPGWTNTLAYHPSLMMATVPHTNGLTETIAMNGTTLMARPASITANFTGGSWATGTYAYDGAGNIKAIGSDQFKYDGVSRLLEGISRASHRRRISSTSSTKSET